MYWKYLQNKRIIIYITCIIPSHLVFDTLRINFLTKAATLETYKENGFMAQLRNYVNNYIIIEEHAAGEQQCIISQHCDHQQTLTSHACPNAAKRVHRIDTCRGVRHHLRVQEH
jgi:hypothetical protein